MHDVVFQPHTPAVPPDVARGETRGPAACPEGYQAEGSLAARCATRDVVSQWDCNGAVKTSSRLEIRGQHWLRSTRVGEKRPRRDQDVRR